jgi:hypothetical protein
MEETIEEINIVPTIFLKYREDGNVLLRCLQGEETVDRAFEPRIFKDFVNPKYLLLGIMTGNNIIKLTVCDGSEFENLYHEKWNILLKK